MDVKKEINDWFESRTAALFNKHLNQEYYTTLNNLRVFGFCCCFSYYEI